MAEHFGGFPLGASQFAGGGFVPSPAPGADNAYGGSAQKASRPMSQTMRDVTVRQLISAESSASGDNVFKVDGVELTTFFIVGRIVNRMDSNTTLKLKVDDGTGVMEVVYFMDGDGDLVNPSSRDWVVNSYVRVCGSMRLQDQQKSMMVFNIKLVKDFNEVTYHNLQCIFQHLHLTKGAAAPPAAGPQPVFPASVPAGGGYQGAASAAGHGDMSKLQGDVLSVYSGAIPDTGLHVDEAFSRLAARGMHITRQQVVNAVEALTNDGLLYSTTDDHHHKPTAM
uniref:Replication protein A C-terminal domain-containing protein n=1 Tax=Chlamydomonas euryale TaxID=1486919 RepID=A0A7R9YQK3_9CHLO|mmetsp:Transcript_10170/g.30675  ORF Transcript_10170/g.30675 Transcript_10170/m.30675 type:complete len:281 (+) Transcript_10170:280-1122(+)